jgi:branched-chain amino acid transport system permease protein
MSQLQGTRDRWLRIAREPALLCSLIILAAAATALLSESVQRQVTADMTFLIAAVGLYMFTGLSGILSFGHMAFAAIGGYAAAILVIDPETKAVILPDLPGGLGSVLLDPVTATVVAGLLGAVFAGLIGVALMRAPGMAATLASFAMLVIVNSVAINWRGLTGGSQGMVSVPMTTTIWTVVPWACVAVVAAAMLQRSRWGIRLIASREDEAAARSVGIRVTTERWIAWTVSAFFTGVSGALYAQFVGSFTPGVFYLDVTFLVIVMLVIGGRTSLSGAVVGACVISIAGIALRRAEEGFDVLAWSVEPMHGLRAIGLGLIMLVVLLKRPDGLMVRPAKSRSHRPRRPRPRGGSRPAAADTTPPDAPANNSTDVSFTSIGASGSKGEQ